MEYINRHIVKEIKKQSSLQGLKKSLVIIKDLKAEKKEAFKLWIKNIRISMHLCKYRQVINEIETKKHNFDSLPEEHWKYQCLEIDAIFKLLKKKFIHHPKEISKENSYQYHSCLFWLNQIFLLLEKLVLEFRPDLNKDLDYNKESIMNPIQSIIESHIKFIFCLIVFSQYNHQIHEICSYLSLIERLLPFMVYTSRSNSYIYYERIQLLKVKLFIENCDYNNAMQTIEKNIYLCFDYIRLLGDDDFNIYYYDSRDKNYQNYYNHLNDRENIKNTIINEYKEKEKGIKKPLKKYKKKDSNLNTPISNNNNSNNIFKFNDKSILILNTLSSKSHARNNNNSNVVTLSNKEEQSINNSIKLKNSINNNNKSNDKDINKDFFVTQVQRIKKMDIHHKRIIEDILSNIALNFYLRATIFEHIGNIDSALDSYKEVEWFSMKFLSTKMPNFVKYMSDLLNCAWNNYNLIMMIKIGKEMKNRQKMISVGLEELKEKNKLKKNIFGNSHLRFIKFHKFKNNEQKLKKYLDNLGKQLYKEEEIRNANLFNVFSKTGYVLSTVKMIDNLLSNDFKHVLKKMNKIEITKQKEDIKDLINKTIMKNQKSNHVREIINSKLSAKLNINNSPKGNKSDNIIIKDNNLILRKKHLISIKKLPHRNHKSNNNNYFHYLDQLTHKYSISCKNIDKTVKNCNIFNADDKNQIKKLEKIFINNNNYSSIRTNELRKSIFNFKHYSIEKVNHKKMKSGFSSTRSSHSKEKVEKIPMDKEFFSKEYIKKKIFLDKFCNKEFNFQKNLLKTKSCKEFIKPHDDDFDIKKVKNDAELNFNTILEIAKSTRRKKNLNNILKQNYNIMNKNLVNIGLNKPSNYLYDDNFNSNEIKLKEINHDYNEIISKRNELIKKRKILNLD